MSVGIELPHSLEEAAGEQQSYPRGEAESRTSEKEDSQRWDTTQMSFGCCGHYYSGGLSGALRHNLICGNFGQDVRVGGHDLSYDERL
jgi:hypothetical protein